MIHKLAVAQMAKFLPSDVSTVLLRSYPDQESVVVVQAGKVRDLRFCAYRRNRVYSLEYNQDCYVMYISDERVEEKYLEDDGDEYEDD